MKVRSSRPKPVTCARGLAKLGVLELVEEHLEGAVVGGKLGNGLDGGDRGRWSLDEAARS